MIIKRKEKEKTKLQKRVAKISTPDLMSWSDQALYGIGRSLSTWNKSGAVYNLHEAKQGAEALMAVVDELIARNDN